ncbi:DUF881 domain-containing protein [Actinocatenispora comari]|uniref:Membrane protein n=1 Tax=Actinocatenispora comari TaxID=2807577 RepID=A0A8J4AIF1_9ACTN|nr:DUF881 domain-containing protein [Actinocatenispora comari]GIL29223.1 membrane protein [Actinocatenispora comari]
MADHQEPNDAGTDPAASPQQPESPERPDQSPTEDSAEPRAGTDDPRADEPRDDAAGEAGRDELPPVRWWTHRLPRRSAALIGVLVALLGFALAVQVNSNDSDQALAGARQEDLVRILDTLDSRKERLQQEIASLNSQRQQISSTEQGRAEALKEARQRADDLGILAGTLPAEGPGLSVVFSGGKDGVGASVLLDAVEELRGAGAEAMQVEGSSGGAVRIVASTAFVDGSGRAVLVDGNRLSAPLTLSVIGDGSTMQAALNIPGGVVDTVRQAGGRVSVRQPSVVQVSVTRSAPAARYARPVS